MVATPILPSAFQQLSAQARELHLLLPSEATLQAKPLDASRHPIVGMCRELAVLMSEDRKAVSVSRCDHDAADYYVGDVDVRHWLAIYNLPHLPLQEWLCFFTDAQLEELKDALREALEIIGHEYCPGDSMSHAVINTVWANSYGHFSSLTALGAHLLWRCENAGGSLPYPLLLREDPDTPYEKAVGDVASSGLAGLIAGL